MSEPSIAVALNISQYFREVIDDVFRARQVDATQEATIYLVNLLCSFAHPTEEAGANFDRPLTFVLGDAMATVGAERFRKLRGLGDHTLYAVGFFGGHIEQKGVDTSYVSTVGATAYREAAAMLRTKVPQSEDRGLNVLSELAAKFRRFAEVFRDVSEGTLACGARDERSLVKLYERWLKTGSSRIAEEHGSRGIVPSRGVGGVN